MSAVIHNEEVLEHPSSDSNSRVVKDVVAAADVQLSRLLQGCIGRWTSELKSALVDAVPNGHITISTKLIGRKEGVGMPSHIDCKCSDEVKVTIKCGQGLRGSILGRLTCRQAGRQAGH